jgi:DNA helicase-2/ATP-dependent DNA helicase PcrA
LIDEVQDFNNAQKVMLENLAKNGIRIVVVGDPAQSIYFFRGSDAKGFSNIEDMLKKTTAGASTHALPVNYRSGKKIIDYVNQNTHVKDLKAGRDHEGEVNPDMEEEELINQVQDEMAKDGKLKQETAFISRNNAPLFAISLGLLRNNIPFQIIGDDFSDEILDFIYNVVGNDKAFIGKSEAKYVSIDNFSKMLERYIEAKNDKFENQKDKEKYLQDLNRKNEALVGLIDHLKSQQMAQPKFENINKQKQIETVQDLCDHIQDLFKGLNPDNERDAQAIKNIDKTQTVMLTTAHKSKGLEFERVNIVGDELFPQTSDYSENLGEEEQQKHNLKYVAYTRATHTLNISNTPK